MGPQVNQIIGINNHPPNFALPNLNQLNANQGFNLATMPHNNQILPMGQILGNGMNGNFLRSVNPSVMGPNIPSINMNPIMRPNFLHNQMPQVNFGINNMNPAFNQNPINNNIPVPNMNLVNNDTLNNFQGQIIDNNGNIRQFNKNLGNHDNSGFNQQILINSQPMSAFPNISNNLVQFPNINQNVPTDMNLAFKMFPNNNNNNNFMNIPTINFNESPSNEKNSNKNSISNSKKSKYSSKRSSVNSEDAKDLKLVKNNSKRIKKSNYKIKTDAKNTSKCKLAPQDLDYKETSARKQNFSKQGSISRAHSHDLGNCKSNEKIQDNNRNRNVNKNNQNKKRLNKKAKKKSFKKEVELQKYRKVSMSEDAYNESHRKDNKPKKNDEAKILELLGRINHKKDKKDDFIKEKKKSISKDKKKSTTKDKRNAIYKDKKHKRNGIRNSSDVLSADIDKSNLKKKYDELNHSGCNSLTDMANNQDAADIYNDESNLDKTKLDLLNEKFAKIFNNKAHQG